MNGWECGHGAVGKGVGERAEADHAEDLEPVMFERQGKGLESLVFADEAMDVLGEDCSRGYE